METLYKENPKPELFNVDIDGTLTTGELTDDPEPNHEMIEKLKKRYMDGHHIIIWTARQWETAPSLVSWLAKYSVPYHGIRIGKGGGDHYVDDKMMTFNDF